MGLRQKQYTKPSAVPLPQELPSVEETLIKLAKALEAATNPGLDKAEVHRLQVVANIAKTYKELLADYINYREIEIKLDRMEARRLEREKQMANLNIPESTTTPQPTQTRNPQTTT